MNKKVLISSGRERGGSYEETDGPGLEHNPRLKQRCNVRERIHDEGLPVSRGTVQRSQFGEVISLKLS